MPNKDFWEVRLLVVGKARCGKSSVANTVLGDSKFPVTVTAAYSNILACDWQHITRDGRTIEVTEMRTELEAEEAARALITVTPGPHAIVLCFKCEQFFSAADYFEYSTLKKWLGNQCSKFLILAFSGLDTFNIGRLTNTATAAEAVMRSQFISILRELPSPDRLICLDNSAGWDSRLKQGDRLLRLVDQVVNDNHGGHFSNRKIRSFEEELQYQLGRRGATRGEIKERVLAGEDIELIFQKRACCSLM